MSWYYVVTQEIVEDLNLKGTDRDVYAVIAAFSQQGNGCYYGTRQDLAKYCGVSSKRTVDAAIDHLIDAGLIYRFAMVKDGTPLVGYTITQRGAEIAPPCKNCTPPGQNFHPPKNNNKKIYIERDNNARAHAREDKFIPPTEAEVRAYCQERGNGIDAVVFVAHYNSVGWKVGKAPMQSWKDAVITWERKRRKDAEQAPRRQAPRQDSYLSRMQDQARRLGITTEQTPTRYDEQ